MRDSLLQKIIGKTARVGVIGLGCVGFPLAMEFAKAGFGVIGIDTDRERVEQLYRGVSHTPDVESHEVARRVEEKKFQAMTDFGVIAELDTMNICVPTPLRKTRDPDLSHTLAAVEMIQKHLRRCQLVILESTTYARYHSGWPTLLTSGFRRSSSIWPSSSIGSPAKPSGMRSPSGSTWL